MDLPIGDAVKPIPLRIPGVWIPGIRLVNLRTRWAQSYARARDETPEPLQDCGSARRFHFRW